MARAIDNEAAYRFLSEQLVKETGAFSKGVNKGLNIARSAMRNPNAIPTLTPQNEWERVEERLPEDEAIKELDDVSSAVNDLSDFIDEQIFPTVQYDIYTSLRDNADSISMWMYEKDWRGKKEE